MLSVVVNPVSQGSQLLAAVLATVLPTQRRQAELSGVGVLPGPHTSHAVPSALGAESDAQVTKTPSTIAWFRLPPLCASTRAMGHHTAYLQGDGAGTYAAVQAGV
jgi:hypothetical protein